MNPNDTIVFSTTSTVAPLVLGILGWPNLIPVILIATFITFGCLYIVFKRRNQS